VRQQGRECPNPVPELSRARSYDDWELGERHGEAGNVQDLRGSLQAKEDTPCDAVRQRAVCGGEREKIGRVAVGVLNRVDRLRCLGNGQVPAVAALAWRLLGDD
jgi:hypothetical protein